MRAIGAYVGNFIEEPCLLKHIRRGYTIYAAGDSRSGDPGAHAAH
ncbi:hypothetical protein [Pseudomonas glycinae]|nr:hypothetical protein [Pseudomonas glycinae]